MSKVSDIMASYGGRQSVADADVIVSAMGGRQGPSASTVPSNAITNVAGNGYVINSTGGYVLFGA